MYRFFYIFIEIYGRFLRKYEKMIFSKKKKLLFEINSVIYWTNELIVKLSEKKWNPR